MTARRSAAWIYALLTAVVVLFHLSMAAGAPWGHLTMGGRWPGVLPPVMRGVAVVNAALLASLAVVVLARAGVLRLRVAAWAVWAIVAWLTLAVLVHIATPSATERALWLPQIVVMLASAIVVARAPKP